MTVTTAVTSTADTDVRRAAATAEAAPTTEPSFRRAQRRGAALGELCRIYNARTPIAVLVATAATAAADLRTTVAGVALILSTYAIAAALNDRADVVSDRINGRVDRPLVSGAATARDLRIVLVVGGTTATVAFAALPQPTGVAVAGAAAFIAWASACEPLHLQRRGFVGLVALATGYLVLPIVLVTGVGRLLAVAPLALVGAGVLAHKDVRDEVGDRAAGKRTLLIRVGARPMAIIAAASAVIGTGVLVATLGTGWWLLPAVAATIALATMAVRGHDPRAFVWSRGCLVVLAVAVGGVTGSTVG